MSEIFQVYGIQIKHPENWRVELNPESEWIKGDVAFSPVESKGHKSRKSPIVLSWQALDHFSKKFRTPEEYVRDIITRMKKHGDVKSLDIIEQKNFYVCEHEAIFSHVNVKIYVPTFIFGAKTSERVIRFAVLYCDKSKRCITLYWKKMQHENDPIKETEIFQKLLKSIVCHKV
ncbi:MAG: hypothetical protein ACTSUS_08205 [Candidatus Freyarchaeota archaeon]